MQFLSKENQRLLRHMRRKASRRARYKLHAGPLTQPLRPVKIGIVAFLIDLLVRNDY